MDYADSLRKELTRGHVVFHTVIMSLNDFVEETSLLFFEGDDDPSFYFPHIRARNSSKEYLSFICNGRAEVIKAFELIDTDGRAISRSLFFIDKDHNDLVGKIISHRKLYQTIYYSIENYIVSDEIFEAFWVEILHLDSIDPRKKELKNQFDLIYSKFSKKMKTLMAIVLLSRGYNGGSARKLNLNNLNFDQLFNIDFPRSNISYVQGAGRHFSTSTNAINYSDTNEHPKRADIKNVIKTLDTLPYKSYIRGKYDLWIFVKFLNYCSNKLAARSASKTTGLKRATPKIQLTNETAIENVGSKLRCPPCLDAFLVSNL